MTGVGAVIPGREIVDRRGDVLLECLIVSSIKSFMVLISEKEFKLKAAVPALKTSSN